MSTCEPKHDRALLAVPWLPGGGWLFKYAPHPDRAGYVLIATDLEIVLFESLTAPSIPSRLASLASSASASQRGSTSQRTEGDIVKQAERVLHQLEREVMRHGRTWVESEVVVSEHAFYDRVVEVTSGQFHWVFNMTELKSPQPLMFITKHLLGPLAAAHPAAQNHKDTSPLHLIGHLLAQPDLAQSLVPGPSGPSGPSSRPQDGRTVTQHSDARSASQSVVPESIPEEDEDEVEDEQQGQYEDAHLAASPSPRPRARHPRSGGHVAVTDDEGETSSGEGVNDDETDIPATRTRSHGAVDPPSESASPPQRRSSSRAGQRPSANERIGKRQSEETSSGLARSESPVKPTPTPALTQSSQRTKKEREREEDELMEKRREEIKRKMGAGHGGRLNRRRAAR